MFEPARNKLTHRCTSSLIGLVVGGAMGCTGVIGTVEGGKGGRTSSPPSSSVGTPPASQGGTVAGPAPLARLTNLQYTNTLASLLPGVTLPTPVLPTENVVGGFENVAVAQTPSAELVEAFRSTALAAASAAVADLTKVLPCKVATAADEEPCGKQFISDFGKRAFRRPLSTDETASATAFFLASRTTYGFQTAVSMMIQGFLQAPPFIYRLEFGSPAGQPGTAALNSYEMASRLSYLLWNNMPDAQLLTAADGGQLATAAGVMQQTRRLLADPRAHSAVANFHRQWLRFGKMTNMAKDPQTFPQFGSAMGQAMTESATRFVDHAFWDEGTLDALLTDSHVFVNDALAPVYGLPLPGSSTMQLVLANPSQRAGVMTQAGLMAGFAHPVEDSPVLRGVFVLDRLLCAAPQPPPPDVSVTPPTQGTEGPKTSRQMFESHEEGSCAACHHQIDGIGFSFGNYDAIGAWRTTDNGLPVDANGWVSGTSDLDGSFTGAVELAHKMAASRGVQECVTSKWLGYALGIETPPPAAVSPLADAFIANGRDLRELLVQLVTSDTFRLRPLVIPAL